MFGLTQDDWQTVVHLAIEPLIGTYHARTWVFGSRARGDARPFSDLDILIETQEPLAPSVLAEMRAALEDSNLPVKIDLVDLSTLAQSYRDQVLKERVEVSLNDS